MSAPIESPHNSHLLFIGQQCHAEQCYMVDFLPFRCDHCTHAFCADHYKPTTHACEKYDASKHDRIAPPCPLCNTPVAIPPNQDPNMRMEQHIEKECSVTTGKRSKQGGMPVCAKGKCGKVLFAPIKCNSCNAQYCAAHRFPSSHACSPTASSSQRNVGALGTKFFAKQTSAASTPKHTPSVSSQSASVGLNFFVKQTSSASAATPTPSVLKPANPTKSDAGASGTGPNFFVKSKTDRSTLPPSTYAANDTGVVTSSPFTATSSTPTRPLPSPTAGDTRAKAEQASRRRAMQERAKKGLLSEREQILLAEEEAMLAAESNSGKKDSECALM